MLNEIEHTKATVMRNILARLIEHDMQEKAAAYDQEIDADMHLFCDSISHDGEELILAFPEKPRVIRIRVDYVDLAYIQESRARMEATEGMEDIEDFLKESGNGSGN